MNWLLVTAVALVVDASTGLPKDPGWELVRAHCGACHSHAVIRQQRGDHTFWRATIERMQAQHGLWAFDDETHQTIVDYLARAFAVDPDEVGVRRLPLQLSQRNDTGAAEQ